MASVTFTPAELQALAALVAPLITAAPAPTPVPAPPLPSGTIPHLDYAIYQNGAPVPLDDSWAMRSVNYADTTGQPLGGKSDIAVTLDAPNGGWQPLFVPNGSTIFFDLTPYSYLLISIKPTTDGANYWVGFAGNLDTADGVQIQIAGPSMTTYGPAPKKGVWANYKIPLSAFKMTNLKAVFKFGVACGNFPAGTITYFDNCGLSKS